MRKSITFLCAITLVAVASAQTPKSPQKPGKWQVTMEVDMPGMPMKMKPITQEVCITEADLADPQKSVPQDPKSKCTVSDHKVSGNTVTWAMSCPAQQTKGTGEFTFAPGGDTYNGTMKMQVGDREMSTKYTGKWLGATCTK